MYDTFLNLIGLVRPPYCLHPSIMCCHLSCSTGPYIKVRPRPLPDCHETGLLVELTWPICLAGHLSWTTSDHSWLWKIKIFCEGYDVFQYIRHPFLFYDYLWKCAFKMKWNESGFRPPLCTYGLNWASRISWGWWGESDDTVLQTQDLKFVPWRSEAEHATSRSRSPPTKLSYPRWWGRNIFVSFKPPRPGTEPLTLACKAAVLSTTLGPPPCAFSKRKLWF